MDVVALGKSQNNDRWSFSLTHWRRLSHDRLAFGHFVCAVYLYVSASSRFFQMSKNYDVEISFLLRTLANSLQIAIDG